MNIIEKLYDICAEPQKEQVFDTKKIAGLKYQTLKDKLSEELAEELDSLMNETMVLNLEEIKASFKKGFCMGVEVITEVKESKLKY